MYELALIGSIVLSSLAGTLVGFAAGIVPGLHMNNIAAALTAYAGIVLLAFGNFEDVTGSNSRILISCFISSALVAHLFGEAIVTTYVGIPSEDVVSVLPAHRLAKAGLGSLAVRASADGCFVGILVASAVLFPMCLLMGPPVRLYSFLKQILAFITVGCSIVLVVSEGYLSKRVQHVHGRTIKVLVAVVIFCSSGVLGIIVLRSNYFACKLPDFPWITSGYISRSSLLLPLFAGLFGIPGLLLSLGSKSASDVETGWLHGIPNVPSPRDVVLCLVGGTLVGWLPGMTSGSSAVICSPMLRETRRDADVAESVRFIWLYSAISSVGAVFSVGALFVIMRARSGSMDAIASFLDVTSGGKWLPNVLPMTSILLSMLVAALVSRRIIEIVDSRCVWLRHVLCSKRLVIASLAFVVSLSVVLTGSRGALLMLSSASLGLIPPIIGVRRIQLMGCLLVPISLMFVSRI